MRNKECTMHPEAVKIAKGEETFFTIEEYRTAVMKNNLLVTQGCLKQGNIIHAFSLIMRNILQVIQLILCLENPTKRL